MIPGVYPAALLMHLARRVLVVVLALVLLGALAFPVVALR